MRSGSVLRGLLGPLAFVGLLVAGFLFGQRLERKAEAQGFDTVETDRFAFQLGGAAQGWEAFVDPRWEQLLADRLARLDDFQADDPEGPLLVADALAELSFIEELGAPHVIWPDGIEVPLKLRRPVACVAWRGAFYPVAVDWKGEGGPRGVLLPGASNTPPSFGGGYLPVLGGVTGRLDGVWLEEPSLVAALSVADSNSDTARAMYDRIGEFVAEGYTDEQITDYFVETYGEWVRLEPRTSGANMVLWLMPAGVLVFGVLFIAVRSRPDDDAPAPRPTVATDDPYRARILAELGEPPAPEAPRDP